MLTIDLHQLIRRLSPPLVTALEDAAQECVRRHHRAVTPLHCCRLYSDRYKS